MDCLLNVDSVIILMVWSNIYFLKLQGHLIRTPFVGLTSVYLSYVTSNACDKRYEFAFDSYTVNFPF